MATKQQHMERLEQEDRDVASKHREEQWLRHRERRAQALAELDAAEMRIAELICEVGRERIRADKALAERDEAREELAKLKAAQPAATSETSLRFQLARYVEQLASFGNDVDLYRNCVVDSLRNMLARAAQPAAEASAQPAPLRIIAPEGTRLIGWPPSYANCLTTHAGFTLSVFVGDEEVALALPNTPPAAEAPGSRGGSPANISTGSVLRAGLRENDKLRARVAELEAHVNSYARSYQDEKARADAAKADAGESMAGLLFIARQCNEALQSPGPDYPGPRDAVRAVIERMQAAEAREKALLEALDSVRIFGSDTLSGRVDGPVDVAWYRDAVREMRNRANRAILAGREPGAQQP